MRGHSAGARGMVRRPCDNKWEKNRLGLFYCLLSTVYCLLPSFSYCLLSTVYCLLLHTLPIGLNGAVPNAAAFPKRRGCSSLGLRMDRCSFGLTPRPALV